ncbi:class I SAM-dependent methyltransferase [Hymenobacter guriensis]|uniref:Methyltransferase domain-containing protein n=1 Tax=Hymenobacter guriensis TaxID=2793065 RepID=A0ABS0L4P6_9BACT|nr:methyltransferase domain-containing protein [Hymenobacter guriensis]MBG8555115.1 methyltransferase domain-containing protein [Hymenobacter guriensis]
MSINSQSALSVSAVVEKERWNRAYLDPTWRSTRFNGMPNGLLMETARCLRPGTALDMHMGEGRNALHLAALGWQVTGVDVADQALDYAQEQARQRNLSITAHAQDSHSYAWGHACWDLVVLCYTDEHDHAAHAAQALRPGGLVVFENFHADVNAALGLAPNQQIGFLSGELPDRYAAAGFDILRYEEPEAVADFSLETHRLVRLVACRQ